MIQINRIFGSVKEQVFQWLEKTLEKYYPIVYIDVVLIPIRREDRVSREALYTVLGVKDDRTKEVLAVMNFQTESAIGWRMLLENIKLRGVERIDLIISDALKGIEDSIAATLSGSDIQF